MKTVKHSRGASAVNKKGKPESGVRSTDDESAESTAVHLTPVFGVHPRVYVPAAWLLIAAAAVFFPLVLPGIRRSGTEVTIYTDPPDASILVDGVRAGRSGKAVFVEKGRRRITLRRPGFQEAVSEMNIEGRIFASRLLPRRLTIRFTLAPKDNHSPWPAAVDDFASWAAVGSHTGRYAIPPVLTAAARDAAAGHSPGAAPPAEADSASSGSGGGASSNGPLEVSSIDLLDAVLPVARDNRHLADALRAAWIIENPDTALSPWSLLSFVDALSESALADSAAAAPAANADSGASPADELGPGESEVAEPGPSGAFNRPADLAAGVLGTIAAASRRSRQEGSDTFEELFNRPKPDDDASPPPFDRPETVYDELKENGDFQPRLIGGLPFIPVPGITAPVGDMEAAAAGYEPRFGARPAVVRVEDFLIGMREVSNDEFARFTAENPRWLPGNRDELAASGLADAAYLESWSSRGPGEGSGDEPVTHVSWYAARAYARWFGERFLPAGRTARLPREDEWEIAARINAVVPNTAELPAGIKSTAAADSGAVGILGMAGSVREWAWNPFRYNENLYRPAGGYAAYQQPDHPLASPFRPVRGGSRIDGGMLFPAAVRGAFRAQRSSPVVGFRIVIVGIR